MTNDPRAAGSTAMDKQRTRPLLIVISAPSGAGKTTLCDRLLEERADLVYSISCTTRPSRGSEEDAEDYFFLSEEEFDRRKREGLFLEHAVVHGSQYGTLRKTVESALKDGDSILMDIDVQGAAQVRQAAAADESLLKDAFVDIFVAPPSLETLRVRLEGRNEDSAGAIEERLRNAADEMTRASEFRYRVENDDLAQAWRALREIVEWEASHG